MSPEQNIELAVRIRREEFFAQLREVQTINKNLNRNFIGIELDPTYFEIAKRRIYEQV